MALLSSLSEATELDNTDILHLRTTGGIDKKITALNLLSLRFKNHIALQLTEYDTTAVPEIEAGGVCEIDGELLTNTGTITITGTTVNDTHYGIQLTKSGTTYTASFVADGTGTWSNTKQGVYNGSARIVGSVYRDPSGNFIDKNIFIPGRMQTRRIQIGFWDMNATATVRVRITTGIWIEGKIRDIRVGLNPDPNTQGYLYNASAYVGNSTYQAGCYWTSSRLSTDSVVLISRYTTAFLAFNDTDVNRGWILLKYEP